MATTAETYGFGARAPYATPRASEHDMKEKARLSGLFPRVRNEPMSKQLQVLLKEFEQNAALTGILERRRLIEERSQYNLQGREAMDAVNRNLPPPFRIGTAVQATSARVAQRVAGIAPPADAEDVMTGGAYSTGGSESSTANILSTANPASPAFSVASAAGSGGSAQIDDFSRIMASFTAKGDAKGAAKFAATIHESRAKEARAYATSLGVPLPSYLAKAKAKGKAAPILKPPPPKTGSASSM